MVENKTFILLQHKEKWKDEKKEEKKKATTRGPKLKTTKENIYWKDKDWNDKNKSNSNVLLYICYNIFLKIKNYIYVTYIVIIYMLKTKKC